MKKMQTIVFVSHESLEAEQTLFEWTLDLAERNGASVHLVRVLPGISPGLAAWLQHTKPIKVMDQQAETQTALLQPWRELARSRGVSCAVEVAFGKLFVEAIRRVNRYRAGLLVKLADNPAHPVHTPFGSQDRHLLRKCPGSLLLHKPGAPLPYRSVAAAIDVTVDYDRLLEQTVSGDDANPVQDDSMNASILDWAHYLQPRGLKVVHAWQSEAEELVYHWNTDLTEADLLEFKERERHYHQAALDEEVAAYREQDADLQTYLPKGVAETAIVAWLEQNLGDLLVMGTLGRSGLSGWLIGNTAEEILENLDRSVLAIKPEGFVSPIE